MSEIKKTCNNCKHCNCPPSNDPCKTCLTRSFTEHKFDTMWESKEDEKDDNLVKVAKLIHENGIYGFGSGFAVLPIYSDTVFKTENDGKIDHIYKRVDDIQHNVLVYGNDIVSKIIAIQDKIGMTPDADIYLKDIRQDLCDLDTKLDGLESMLKDIQKTLNDLPTISDISRIEDRIINMGKIESKIDELDGLDIKQFTVNEGPTEKELEEAHERLKKMTKDEHITLTSKKDPLARAAETSYRFANRPDHKFNDGDLVKISGEKSKNKIWIVRTSIFDCLLNSWYYSLIDTDDNTILIHEPEYKLAKYEPKFKVGDLVKYKTGSVSYFVIDVKESNYKYFYDLERRFFNFHNSKRDYKITGILESKLEEVK